MAIDRRRGAGGYVPLRDALDQLFQGSVLSPQVFGTQAGFPPADLYVSEDHVLLDLALAGANPEEINISVTGDTVTISGEVRREAREKTQTLVDEIWHGRFQRAFALPIQVDANGAEASFNNGILELRLPKSEATRPRKIQVTRQQPTIQNQSAGKETASTRKK